MERDATYLELIAEVNKVRTFLNHSYADIGRLLGYSKNSIRGFMSCNPRNTSKPVAEALQKYVNDFYENYNKGE